MVKNSNEDIAPTISIKAKENWSWSKGEAELLTRLGYACEKGTFVEQDYKAALQFYQLAGKAGDNQGLSNLAWMYQNGFGIEKDVQKAIEIYEKAADDGNSTAMINLGNIYEYGELGEPDYKKCFKWYKKAAEQGEENAQEALKRLGADEEHNASQTDEHVRAESQPEKKYYLINDSLVGKMESGKYYLYQGGEWKADDKCEIMDRLHGYDPSEPPDSPYGFGNSSILNEIREISEEAQEFIQKEYSDAT